jgi:hypothetical protein
MLWSQSNSACAAALGPDFRKACGKWVWSNTFNDHNVCFTGTYALGTGGLVFF